MLKNMTERKVVWNTEYYIDFLKDGGGFGFKADANGNVILENDAQRENYEYAMSHPEDFPDAYNQFNAREYSYVEPATGECVCGNTVALINEYMGACECEKCGRWYNLFGQSLKDPEYWTED